MNYRYFRNRDGRAWSDTTEVVRYNPITRIGECLKKGAVLHGQPWIINNIDDMTPYTWVEITEEKANEYLRISLPNAPKSGTMNSNNKQSQQMTPKYYTATPHQWWETAFIRVLDGKTITYARKTGATNDITKNYDQPVIDSYLRNRAIKEITEAEALALLDKGAKVDFVRTDFSSGATVRTPNNTRLNFLNQKRDSKGRFRPKTPKVLRKGSLYKLSNVEIGTASTPVVARYRGPAFGEFLVFSNHGAPLVAKQTAVEFADKADVDSYVSVK